MFKLNLEIFSQFVGVCYEILKFFTRYLCHLFEEALILYSMDFRCQVVKFRSLVILIWKQNW